MPTREQVEELHRQYMEEGLTLEQAAERAVQMGITRSRGRERMSQIFESFGLHVMTRKERGEITKRRNRGGA